MIGTSRIVTEGCCNEDSLMIKLFQVQLCKFYANIVSGQHFVEGHGSVAGRSQSVRHFFCRWSTVILFLQFHAEGT